MNEGKPSRTAWAQLYEARRIPTAPETEAWQNRFSELLGRKVSIGESIGILTRICSTRLSRLPYKQPFRSLSEMVEKMVEEG
jgi:hypothetical protein